MPPKKAPVKNAPRIAATNKKTPVSSKKVPPSNTKKPGVVKNAQKEPKKEVKKGPTKEDLAAIIIQKYIKRFLAEKKLQRLKNQKQEYEDTIEKLQREAFVAMVKAEQVAAEKQLEREEEERRRKREEVKRRKRMLEAAFDGEVNEMMLILKEVEDRDTEDGIPGDEIGQIVRNQHLMSVIECEDANNNTPLSEAAGGGSVEAITFLVESGADPNTIGAWGRTPLYRAAFGGHMSAVECLLGFGADPRIYAQDGNTPAQVASVEAIVETIDNWDVTMTDSLLQKMALERERRLEENLKRKNAETDKLQGELVEVQRIHDAKQKVLEKCYIELEKRIKEHDKAVHGGFDNPQLTLTAVKDAEGELEIAKLNAMKSREKLEQARLTLREQQNQGGDDELPGVKCNIRELDEVLMRDVGNRLRDCGRWPMLIDPSGQAGVFLRYRDTNYLCALNPHHMQQDVIRMALIGAIRFGKPLVLDMLEVDMFDTVSDLFQQISPQLMDDVMNKDIIKDERYMKLVYPTDPDDYQKSRFQHHRVQNFLFVILTKNKYPSDLLIEKTYPIRIVLPEL